MKNNNDPDDVVLAWAKEVSPPPTPIFDAAYSFRARAAIVASIGDDTTRSLFENETEIVLKKCLAGDVLYPNPILKIHCGIKVEGWLFCAEENLLIDETKRKVCIGGFHGGYHYIFEETTETPRSTGEAIVGTLLRFVVYEVLSVHYPEGIRFGETEACAKYLSKKGMDAEKTVSPRVNVIFSPLRRLQTIPNVVKVSEFLEDNPDALSMRM